MRRYYRNTEGANAETTDHVFDGGRSVQEYSVATDSDPLTTTNLSVEFIRGEGMGGGVGGMVYSLKHPEPSAQNQEPSIICSHANHRGDVIARSDSTGSLISFARYEAYGTHEQEWGSDPDRQKANTKEEESDLGLLNEGMRFRDLETGVFLTRDPIGYGDGPNVYCYVHCSPITSFDLLGLITISFYNSKAEGGSVWGRGGSPTYKADGDAFMAAAKINKENGAADDRVIDVSSADEMIKVMKEIARNEVIDSIVIYEHGEEGNQLINGNAITDEEYLQMGALLKENGDKTPNIELKGCNVAGGPNGTKNIQRIADISGARVSGGRGSQEYQCLETSDSFLRPISTGVNWQKGSTVIKDPRPLLDLDDLRNEIVGSPAPLYKYIEKGGKVRGDLRDPRNVDSDGKIRKLNPDTFTLIPHECD